MKPAFKPSVVLRESDRQILSMATALYETASNATTDDAFQAALDCFDSLAYYAANQELSDYISQQLFRSLECKYYFSETKGSE